MINDREIPDFSIPSSDCFLTVDKNGNQLKVGDIVSSNLNSLRGSGKSVEKYNPVENRNGKLIIPHYGSYLVSWFVECHCEIVK